LVNCITYITLTYYSYVHDLKIASLTMPQIYGKNNNISTMALAGTKFNINSDWGDKEYSEQQIVQDEILESLKPLCSSVAIGKTQTISAGKIQHLKTDFKGTTRASTIRLVNALFPTSAVAGYPRKAALKLLSKHEEHERSLFSGFLGTC
jgi:isochorismate synthase